MAGPFPTLSRTVLIRFLSVLILSTFLLSGQTVLQPHAAPLAAGTITVDTLVDENDTSCSDGDCSLRDAVYVATAGSTIDFSVTGTITLNGSYILILKDLTISGPGAENLTIDGDASSSIFGIGSTTEVTISSLTITNGLGNSGGGIVNSGTLTLDDCVISGNEADGGGGVYNSDGTLTLNRCTISGNSTDQRGGGIQNRGTTASMTLNNCTVSGNDSVYFGGGIYNEWGTVFVYSSAIIGNDSNYGGGVSNDDGTFTLYTTTISGNTAIFGGGGVYNRDGSINAVGTTSLNHCTITDNTADEGGGISNYQSTGTATVNFENSLVFGNHLVSETGTEDCDNAGGTFVSYDYNLTGIGTGCSLGGTHDQTTADAILLPLADNGGPTQTHALDTGSPAIDQIPDGTNGCGSCYPADQRGVSRPQGTHCDIGSFEVELDKDNVGFYVPSKYRWYLKNDRSDGWSNVTSFGFGGVSELVPITGDWDGDGVDTPGFYKPSQWRWYLKNNQDDGWTGFTSFRWGGSAEMVPVAGDWDGDGIDTVGLYKYADCEWYLKDEHTEGWTNFTTVTFCGAAENLPITGDWDGDGTDTIGFFVPSQRRWYLKNDLVDGWSSVTAFNWGTVSAYDMDPVAEDWDADGVDTVGAYVADKWRWFLKDDQTDGWSNVSSVKFGVTADYDALAGDWE